MLSNIMPKMPNPNNMDKQIDLLNILNDLKIPDKLAEFIGALIIFIISLVIIYIGTWQVAYAKQFYNATFKINFLEGVQPGMKIRYQGGVTIGEVTRIETNFREHYLHCIIRNDFKIIKYGTRITLKEQGSFGSSYLDISTIPYYFSGETYESGDIIEVSQIVPFQDTLNGFFAIFKTENNKDSLIVKRLNDLKFMMYELLLNKHVLPSEVRSIVRIELIDMQNILKSIEEFNMKLFNTVEKMNVSLNNVAGNLRHDLPVIIGMTKNIYVYIKYNPNLNQEDKFLHDEQLYYSIIMRLKIINIKLRDYKDFPYKIIFESGF